MKGYAWVVGALLAATPAAAESKAPAGKAAAAKGPALQSAEEKTLYALGAILGQKITAFQLSADELAIVQRGLLDQVHGATLAVDMEKFGPKVNDLAMTRLETLGKAFREKAAKEPGAAVTASGLVFRTLTPATGAQPKATDTVKVDYEGKLIDGTVFDSSIKRGQPISFPLSQVIPCWTEGVQKMHIGEKAQLVCPAKIAYGDHGAPEGGIPPNATLVFEVHLLGIDTK